MNRIDRVAAILIQLQSKRIITAQEIAQRFHVSVRTVYRDIRTLEEAGIPIGSEAGKGYYLVDGYLLPPVMFTSAEVASLITAGKFIHGFADESSKASCDSAMDKIKAVLKCSDKDNAQELENRIGVYNTVKRQTTLENGVLATIQTAICDRKVLSIRYLSSGKQEPVSRMIEPISVGYYEQNWRLIAYCRLRSAYRSFRLDRIQSLRLEESEFRHKHDRSLDQILQEMLSYNELHRVVLKVDKGVIHSYLKDRYSLGFLDETDLGDRVLMTLQADSLDILAKQLMECGPGIEIVEPEELKSIVRMRLVSITEHCNELVGVM